MIIQLIVFMPSIRDSWAQQPYKLNFIQGNGMKKPSASTNGSILISLWLYWRSATYQQQSWQVALTSENSSPLCPSQLKGITEVMCRLTIHITSQFAV